MRKRENGKSKYEKIRGCISLYNKIMRNRVNETKRERKIVNKFENEYT